MPHPREHMLLKHSMPYVTGRKRAITCSVEGIPSIGQHMPPISNIGRKLACVK